MCTSCGCGQGEARVEGSSIHHGEHMHSLPHSHSHSHAHEHGPDKSSENDIHFGKGAARSHAPGISQQRMVQIEQSILSKNDQYAEKNRAAFALQNILALNLVSSPGSGKTTLLTTTLNALKDNITLAVIEGDQETANDAERIRQTGVSAVQVNTGKGCHLDAHMIGHAMEQLSFEQQGVLFIENVGNLVCPAGFDLGEAHKVVILSVTEGEDKPLKYPDMFHAADVMLLNKVDLLPYLNFDIDLCIENARKINPQIEIIKCSATSGEGMQEWYQWLEQRRVKFLKEQLVPLNQKITVINNILDKSLLGLTNNVAR